MPNEQHIRRDYYSYTFLWCAVYKWPRIFILFILNCKFLLVLSYSHKCCIGFLSNWISCNVFRWIHFIIFIRILSWCALIRTVHLMAWYIWPCDKDLLRDYGLAKHILNYNLIILIIVTYFFFFFCVWFCANRHIFLCVFFIVAALWLSDSISLCLPLSLSLSLSRRTRSLYWKSTSYVSMYHTYLLSARKFCLIINVIIFKWYLKTIANMHEQQAVFPRQYLVPDFYSIWDLILRYIELRYEILPRKHRDNKFLNNIVIIILHIE
jgi:hypothetical protein